MQQSQHPMTFLLPLKRNKKFFMCAESYEELRTHYPKDFELTLIRQNINVFRLNSNTYLLKIN